MLQGQTSQALSRAIDKGLAFIAREQLSNGGFASYSSVHETDFSVAKKYHTTFFPSLVLAALADCKRAPARRIKQQIAALLMSQKSDNWSFNYWDRQSLETRKLPYPDDLDDTFCALFALQRYDPKLFDGELGAHIAKLLIATETVAGGPYRTWLVAKSVPKIWQDTDVVVNANIARFLATQDVTLPNITGFIEQAITAKQLSSPYYPNIFPLIYFVASWYQGEQIGELRQLLENKQKAEKWQHPLQAALAISALLQLGYPAQKVKKYVHDLLSAQAKDGSWPIAAFCIDPNQQGKRAYAGAAALTTALCIEALSLYSKTDVRVVITKSKTNPQYAQVKKQVLNVVTALDSPELKQTTRAVLTRLIKQDSDQQIVMLPWLIAKVIQKPVEEKLLVQLATANLWGWMAYTVYDDFLDNEGQPIFLPSANVCFRNLIITLQGTLPENLEFHAEVEAIMNRLDGANVWEVTHCRGTVQNSLFKIKILPDYGDYWQLADRSLGHTIAALGVLYAADFKSSDKSMQSLRDFFRHYLIARQLNDDMHDWEEDLQFGHVNAVGVEILKSFSDEATQQGLDLKARKTELQTILWEKVAPSMCRVVMLQVTQARAALKQLRSFDTSLLERLVRVHEQIAEETLRGRNDAFKFIKTLAD